MKWLLIAALISTSVFSAEPKKKRWDELMAIVNQEMKILEHAKRKNPELLYRILELHSERLKLIHEKNNKEFLALKKGKDKESYFEETRAYYLKTKNYGLDLLKASLRFGKREFITPY
jgi:intein-encoded DNA endonuclease-like protein